MNATPSSTPSSQPIPIDADTSECPFCAERVSIRAKKCKHCGETIDVAMRKAEEALRASERSSGPVYMNAAVSHNSGYAAPSANKSRIAAIILALFLGGLGAHKFYLGRTGWGVLYLLFCWTFIPSAIAFIEAIVYLFTSDASFNRKYG